MEPKVAEKMGMVPSNNIAVQLRNVHLYTLYQMYQREVDACNSYEEVLKLGIIPKNLQKSEDFKISSSTGFLKCQ